MKEIKSLVKGSQIIRIAAGAVAATTDVVATVVDTANLEGVVFMALLGTVTSGGVPALVISQCETSNGSFVNITGATKTTTSAGSDKALIVEVMKPTMRYLTATLTRGTQNAVCDGIMAIGVGPRNSPVTQGATVVAPVSVFGIA
jgi:hypothetical protein